MSDMGSAKLSGHMVDGGRWWLERAGRGKLKPGEGAGGKALTPPGPFFHCIPINVCLWLQWPGLKAKKENLCPVIPMGSGRTRQQPYGTTGAEDSPNYETSSVA